MQAIADWLPPETSAATAAPAQLDDADVERVSARLRALCAEMDSEAEELVEREQAVLASAYPGHFAAIALAVKDFDFDSALAALDQAQAARARPMTLQTYPFSIRSPQ